MEGGVGLSFEFEFEFEFGVCAWAVTSSQSPLPTKPVSWFMMQWTRFFMRFYVWYCVFMFLRVILKMLLIWAVKWKWLMFFLFQVLRIGTPLTFPHYMLWVNSLRVFFRLFSSRPSNEGVENGGTPPTFTIFNYVFSPLIYH